MQKHATPNIPSTLENLSRTTARQEQELGLDQLSRMVHEASTKLMISQIRGNSKGSTSPLSEPFEQQAQSRTDHMHNYGVNTYTQSTVLQHTQLTDANAISALSLRASPIEDIAIEREHDYRNTSIGTQSLQSDEVVSESSNSFYVVACFACSTKNDCCTTRRNVSSYD